MIEHREYTDTYIDQFTPCYEGCDFSYDGLEWADNGVKVEHLAPLGRDFWYEANGTDAVIHRVFIFDKYLKSITQKSRN